MMRMSISPKKTKRRLVANRTTDIGIVIRATRRDFLHFGPGISPIPGFPYDHLSSDSPLLRCVGYRRSGSYHPPLVRFYVYASHIIVVIRFCDHSRMPLISIPSGYDPLIWAIPGTRFMTFAANE